MKIIAYYTLADVELDGQKPAVEAYAAAHNAKIAAQYVEKWHRKHPWTKLTEAIERAKATDSLLVIAKLGRLEFNVAVSELLTQSGLQFVCLDKPGITPSSIKEVMERAWDKSKETSRRKRVTFTAMRKKGVKLASARPDHWKGREHLRDPMKAAKASAISRTERANQAYSYLVPQMQEIRAEVVAKAAEMQELAEAAAKQVKGRMADKIDAAKQKVKKGLPGAQKALDKLITERRAAAKEARKPYSYPIFETIAERLNALGHVTTIGTPFNGPTVCRILQRAERNHAT
jgi:hypothetical protein